MRKYNLSIYVSFLLLLLFIASGVIFIKTDNLEKLQTTDAYTTNCSASNILVERVSSSILYTDYPPGVTYEISSAYAGYRITNDTGLDIDDLWVQIENFTGTNIYKAVNEDGRFHPGLLANGDTVYAYFYITSNDPGNGSFSGNHDISLYSTRPDLAGGSICGSTFSLTSENNIAAAANKVVSYVTGPIPPELGGLVHIEVCGETGTIGSAGIFAGTPATFSSWRADAYELRKATFIFDKFDPVDNPSGTNIIVNDVLYVDATSPQPVVQGYYCVKYEFKANGTTATPTNISPVTHIASGTQVKHTNGTDSFVDDPITFPPIEPATNTTLIGDKSASPSSFLNGGTVTYSIEFTNNGTVQSILDDIEDTIPTTPGISSYVPGSSYWNGQQIDDPFISGTNNEVLTFINSFVIPADGTTRILKYDVLIPDVDGTYMNSAVAHIASEQIDTTYDVSDNAPATQNLVSNSTITSDLSVSKVDSVDPITAGDQITYTITVTNNGPSDSTGGVVTDSLPVGTIYNDSLSSGTCDETALNSGFVECTFGALTNGSSTNFTIVVDTDTYFSGTITNHSSVVGNEADPTLTNNDTTDPTHPSGGETTVINPAPLDTDLVISKTDSPDPVTEGNSLTYTITVTNNGPDQSSGGTVTDNLPAGVTYIDIISDSRCSETFTGSRVVNCDFGTLANGATTTFELIVDINAGTSGTINNSATVVANETDNTPGNNSTGNVSTFVNGATVDLSLSKSANLSTIEAGNPLTYTLTVTNNGPDPSVAATITDTLPTGVTYNDGLSNAACDETSVGSGTVECSIGSMPVSSIYTYNIVVDVDSSTVGNITNHAVVSGLSSDPVATNNDTENASHPTGGVTTTVTAPPLDTDLEISKTDTTDPIVAGNQQIYTVTVTNNGPDDSTGGTVTDTLPSGVTYNDAASSATCDETSVGSGVVECAFGTLANAASVNFTIAADIDITTSGTITNHASVAANNIDADLTNNDTEDPSHPTGGTSTTVNAPPTANLRILKSADQSSMYYDNQLTYTLSASNGGGSNATGVVVTDTLPSGVTYNDALSDAICNETSVGSGIVECTIGNFNAGVILDFDIVVDVDEGTTGSITNHASITGNEDDPDLTDNDTTDGSHPTGGATTSVTAPPIVDLAVSKTDNIDPIIYGNDLTYTITVTNNGPDESTGGTVTDTLPVGVTYNDASSDSRCNETSVGSGVVECTLGSLANGANRTYDVVVGVDNGTVGTITNNVAVSGNEDDPDLTDNDTTNPSHPIGGTQTVTGAPPSVDLLLSKTVDQSAILYGNDLTYTLTVTNNGPDDSTGGTVTDTLPTGVTYNDSSSDSRCNETFAGSGIVECTLGTLVNAANTTYDVVVNVDEETVGTITNHATVLGNEDDPDLTDNDTTNGSHPTGGASTTVSAPSVDLTISKTDNIDPIEYGNILTYTVTLTNNGPDESTGGTVTDTLPSGVTYNDALSDSRCIETSVGSGIVECTFGSLTNTSNTTFDIAVDVDEGTTGTITNHVAVAGNETDPDLTDNDTSNGSHPSGGTQTTTVAPPSANLRILKSVDQSTIVYGNQLTYTLSASNGGGDNATGVVVTDSLPTGVTYNDALSDAICNETSVSSGVVECVVGNLTAGQILDFDIVVDVDEGTTGEIINNASITGNEIDPDLTDNDTTDGSHPTGGVSTIVTAPSVDLEVSILDSADPIITGSDLVYTVTAANNGPQDSTGGSVTVALDGALNFESINSDSNCSESSPGSKIVVCTFSSLVNAASIDYVIASTSNGNYSGPITTHAVITGNENDPDLDNNDTSNGLHPSGGQTTQVNAPSVDVSIEGSTNSSSVQRGDTVVFLITRRSHGPQDSSGQIVTATLPDGLTFNSISSDSSCTEVSTNIIECDFSSSGLQNGNNSSFNIVATVDLDATGTLETNLLIEGNEDDADLTNNDTEDIAHPSGGITISVYIPTDNTNEETDPYPPYDLIVEIDDQVDFTSYNSLIIYDIYYLNDGPLTLKNAYLELTIPDHSEFNPLAKTTAAIGSVWECEGNDAGDKCTYFLGTLTPHEEGQINFSVRTVDYSEGVYNYISLIVSVFDDGSAGGDQNSNNNISLSQTPIIYETILEPPVATKIVSDSSDNELEWRMVWLNSGNVSGIDVLMYDNIPIGSTYIPGSVVCEAQGDSLTTRCEFNEQENRLEWEGTIAPDFQVENEGAAENKIIITFRTLLLPNYLSFENQGTAYWDDNKDGNIEDDINAGQVAVVTNDPYTTNDGDPTGWSSSELADTGISSLLSTLIPISFLLTAIIIYFNIDLFKDKLDGAED